jgi:CDP-glucose 4,6-dehydratase
VEFTHIDGLRSLPGPILVTGHTGFKGTWLTLLLEFLGLQIAGVSLPPTNNSLYVKINRLGAIEEHFIDIRDSDAVNKYVNRTKPSAILHLAAQPLVIESYNSPKDTFGTNVMGTVNVLEAARNCESVRSIAIITTDKVYKNENQHRKFNENDPLEGHDPYAASKVASEAAAAAWRNISKTFGGPQIIAMRAGNVIGGGDYSENRLIPDLIRAWQKNEVCEIRSPQSTRPWQHVLDPLLGYLYALDRNLDIPNYTPSYNFGPSEPSLTVEEVTAVAQDYFGNNQMQIKVQNSDFFPESKFLDLNSQLAQSELNWRPHLSQVGAIKSTFAWWEKVERGDLSALEACRFDINKLTTG